MAVVVNVSFTEVTLTATATAGGTLLRYVINPPEGTTVSQLQAQLTAAAGPGGLTTYLTTILDQSLTITSINLFNSNTLVPPPPAAPFDGGSSGGGLDGGAIAGIVIGLLFGFILIAVAFYLFMRRKKRIETTTIIPDVGERALIQPPALPPDVAEGAAGTITDRVPTVAPVEAEA